MLASKHIVWTYVVKAAPKTREMYVYHRLAQETSCMLKVNEIHMQIRTRMRTHTHTVLPAAEVHFIRRAHAQR